MFAARAASLPRFRIRRAWPHEAGAISGLARRSKASWGYSGDEMRVFEAELVLSPETVVARRAHVLEASGRVAGFYTLAWREERVMELEHLFVEPAFMGQGFGARLLEHALASARRAGGSRVVVQSDPNAAGFYLRYGAVVVRRIPSSLPDRDLPLLQLGVPGPGL